MEEEAMSEDYSASATLIQFDQPISLLRGPLLAGSSDDTSLGTFVLAFKDAASWRIAYRETESKIIEQCMAGARVGCAISASKKCSPPWWKSLFGPATDFSERERCEERETEACLAAAREPCLRLAKEKCLPAFRDARIASTNLKQIAKTATSTAEDNVPLPKGSPEVTNFRGSVLLQVAVEQKRGTE